MDAVTQQTPRFGTPVKVAAALAITGGVVAITFGVLANFYFSKSFGLLAVTGAALFGVSIEPLWGAWKGRDQAAREAERKASGEEKPAITPLFTSEKAALATVVVSGLVALTFSILATRSNPIVFGALAAFAGGIFGVSMEPVWKAWKRREVEQQKEEKPPVETEPKMPKITTPEKVAMVCLVVGGVTAVTFGILANFYFTKSFGLVAVTGGALFGVSMEPLWGMWKGREKAVRDFEQKSGAEKPAITPFFTSEKVATGLLAFSGVAALALSIAATRSHPILLGGFAAFSGAIFGVSVEPFWAAWKRREDEKMRAGMEDDLTRMGNFFKGLDYRGALLNLSSHPLLTFWTL